MSNKIYFLVALMLTTFTLSSCLKDESDNKTTTYNDTAITAFSLGQLTQVRDTVTKDGRDSVYKKKFNASKVKFYIDQAQGLIYNPDSLPYGTDVAHVLTKVSTKNFGTVVFTSNKDGKQYYYSENDSLDFTQPIKFRVYSASGDSYRDYRISVNAHKQKGNVFTWTAMRDNSNFASLTTMKTVSVGDKLFVFGVNGSQTVGYTTSITDGNSWVRLNKTFSANAYKGILSQGSKLFAVDNNQVLTSTDGNTWAVVATNGNLKQLVAASSSELFALTTNDKLVVSKDGGLTWTNESLDSDASYLPVNNVSYVLSSATGNENVSHVMLVGQTAAGKSVVWTRLSDSNTSSIANQWTLVESNMSRYLLPVYKHLTVVRYDNAALAMGLTASNEAAQMLLSRDGGITWTSDAAFSYPKDVRLGNTFTAAVDKKQFVWIISGSKVWRGRLNRVAWDINLSSATE